MDRDDISGSVGGFSDEPGQDEKAAWAALQHSDPAQGVGTDTVSLRNKVSALIAGASESVDDAATLPSHDEPGVTSIAPVHPIARKRKVWVAVAAAGAIVALSGGGGYAIGALTGGSSAEQSDLAVESPGLPIFDSPARQGGGQDSAASTASEMAADGAQGDRVSAASGAGAEAKGGEYGTATSAWGSSRFRFTGSGLSSERSTAEVWAYDSTGVATKKRVGELADVLGVKGEPTSNDWGWQVGSDDGTSPNVTLSYEGNVYFYDPSSYDVGDVEVLPTDDVVGTDSIEPRDGEEPAVSAPKSGKSAPKPASDETIRARIDEITGALGVDIDGAKFEFSPESDGAEGGYRRVSLSTAVDRTVTESTSRFSFRGDTLTDFSGDVANVVSLGEYEIISPAEALERLQDPAITPTRWPVTQPKWLETLWADEGMGGSAPGQPLTAPAPGSKIAMPIANVKITKAELGLSTYYEMPGSRLLLPTYQLSDADGATWQVIAIADDAIDFSVD